MLTTETKSLNELETSSGQKTPTLTDGMHLVVDALKLNGIDTIYGVAGISIMDVNLLDPAEGIKNIGFLHRPKAGKTCALAGYLTRKAGISLSVSSLDI